MQIEVRYEVGVPVYYCHEPGCGGKRRGDIVGMMAHLADVHKISLKDAKQIIVAHTSPPRPSNKKF